MLVLISNLTLLARGGVGTVWHFHYPLPKPLLNPWRLLWYLVLLNDRFSVPAGHSFGVGLTVVLLVGIAFCVFLLLLSLSSFVG